MWMWRFGTSRAVFSSSQAKKCWAPSHTDFKTCQLTVSFRQSATTPLSVNRPPVCRAVLKTVNQRKLPPYDHLWNQGSNRCHQDLVGPWCCTGTYAKRQSHGVCTAAPLLPVLLKMTHFTTGAPPKPTNTLLHKPVPVADTTAPGTTVKVVESG